MFRIKPTATAKAYRRKAKMSPRDPNGSGTSQRVPRRARLSRRYSYTPFLQARSAIGDAAVAPERATAHEANASRLPKVATVTRMGRLLKQSFLCVYPPDFPDLGCPVLYTFSCQIAQSLEINAIEVTLN